MTVKEVADQIGITPKALYNRLKRADIQVSGINQNLEQGLANHIIDGKPIKDFAGVTSIEFFKDGELLDPKKSPFIKPGDTPINGDLKHEFSKVIIGKEIDLIKDLQEQHLQEIESYKKLIEEEQASNFRKSAKLEQHEAKILQLNDQVDQMKEQHKNEVERLQKAMRDQINDNPITNTRIATIALPMLALPASYCVYYFASFFVPTWVAISEGAAMELTYIGLAVIGNMNKQQRKLANQVSLGAVLVSIIYATIAGAIHMEPTIMEELQIWWVWILGALYGMPLALLGYHLSKLLFNK